MIKKKYYGFIVRPENGMFVVYGRQIAFFSGFKFRKLAEYSSINEAELYIKKLVSPSIDYEDPETQYYDDKGSRWITKPDWW